MRAHRKSFQADELVLVRSAPPADDPPLTVGDLCVYNSGSPALLVVDCNDEAVTFSWQTDNEVHEHSLPRACVRRAGT
jgi:hypothetical protein